VSREAILERIRLALGRTPEAPAPAIPETLLGFPPMEMEQRITRFTAALEALGGRVLRASSPSEAAEMIAEITAGADAVASEASFLRACGIDCLPGVRSDFSNAEEYRASRAEAAFGITSADYALAETGSLVLLSGREESRLVSLLPPAHIAVLPLNRLLTNLNELLTLLPHPAELTSAMVIVTGPSRTADIEQILVRGVHGPGEITVILVDAPYSSEADSGNGNSPQGI
jgi:L-lactate dehydrogenase complex protein LldG